MTTPPPSPLAGMHPLIRFRDHGVPPPSLFYFQRDDQVVITSINSLAGVLLDLTLRVLTSLGEIVTTTYRHIPLSTRAVATQNFQIGEGFLISAVVSEPAASAHSVRGQTYVEVKLFRSGPTLGTPGQTLIQGYVSFTDTRFWPWDNPADSLAGLGFPGGAAPAAPAVGVDFAITVPAGAVWELQAFRATLTASGAAANRNVSLRLTNPAGGIVAIPTNVTQTATQVITYQFGQELPFSAAIAGVATSPLPAGVLLPAGSTIQTVTSLIDAGDQWSTGASMFAEWLALQ
jgi:hypothetical protein